MQTLKLFLPSIGVDSLVTSRVSSLCGISLGTALTGSLLFYPDSYFHSKHRDLATLKWLSFYHFLLVGTKVSEKGKKDGQRKIITA